MFFFQLGLQLIWKLTGIGKPPIEMKIMRNPKCWQKLMWRLLIVELFVTGSLLSKCTVESSLSTHTNAKNSFGISHLKRNEDLQN